MSTDADEMPGEVVRIHQRIDKLITKNDAAMEKLNEVHSDVRVIKKTCEERGKTCKVQVEGLSRTLQGSHGVLVRMSNVEQRQGGKERFSYLIMGILGTAVVSLLVGLVIRFFGN